MKPLFLKISLLALMFLLGCDQQSANSVEKSNPSSPLVPTQPETKVEQTTLPATSYAEIQKEIGQNIPMVLEIGSKTCGTCIRMGRLLYRKQSDYPKVQFRFLDVAQDFRAANALGIRVIPMQLFIDAQGNEIFRHVGEYTEATFDAELARLGW